MLKHAKYPLIIVLALALTGGLLLVLGVVVPTTLLQRPVEVPTLASGAAPDYTLHVEAIFNARCLSCHQDNNAQGGYLMTSYDQVMTSGVHAPNVRAGDLGGDLIRRIRREPLSTGGAMPPILSLRPEEISIITRWVEAGALPPGSAK
jgi:hypothetical protein